MQCNTSFTVPYDNNEIRHEKVDCEKALKFIKSEAFPYQYFTKVETIAQRRFLSEKDSFQVLSHAQFECVLNCANKEEKRWKYRNCKKHCLENLVEHVLLNDKDAVVYGKHPPA